MRDPDRNKARNLRAAAKRRLRRLAERAARLGLAAPGGLVYVPLPGRPVRPTGYIWLSDLTDGERVALRREAGIAGIKVYGVGIVTVEVPAVSTKETIRGLVASWLGRVPFERAIPDPRSSYGIAAYR